MGLRQQQISLFKCQIIYNIAIQKLILMSFRFGFRFFNHLKPWYNKISISTMLVSYLIMNQNSNNRIYKCIQIQRLDKPQYVNFLNSGPKEAIIMVYKHHFQANDSGKQLAKKVLMVRNQIQNKNVGIDKIVLVDDLDVKHIQIFQKWIKDQNIGDSAESLKQQYGTEPYNIYYINSDLLSSKPIKITKLEHLERQIRQIRQIYGEDPSQQVIKQSLKRPMTNTIIKSCTTPKCQQSFKQNLVQLIQYRLFDYKDDFKFYLVKDNGFLATLLKKENLGSMKAKEDIYLMRKDVLGQQFSRFSDFSNDSDSVSALLQFIKPRIHVISKNNPEVDFSWYVTTGSHRKPTISFTPHQPYSYIRDYQILKTLHSKYAHAVELMLVDSPKLSQILRHTTRHSPEWVIFNLSSQYQYPKKFLSGFVQGVTDEQRYYKFSQEIKQFLKKPQVYDRIQISGNQINIRQLQSLKQKYNGQKSDKNKQFGLYISMNGCRDAIKSKMGNLQQNSDNLQQESLMDLYCIDGKLQNTGLSEGFVKYQFM